MTDLLEPEVVLKEEKDSDYYQECCIPLVLPLSKKECYRRMELLVGRVNRALCGRTNWDQPGSTIRVLLQVVLPLMTESIVTADTLLSAGTVLPSSAGILLPGPSQGRINDKRRKRALQSETPHTLLHNDPIDESHNQDDNYKQHVGRHKHR
uniref:Uncharacterized protein n=1 Tax=Timema monikensis TaxID=170555 RepID=A0A7R9HTF8_9NEOP|nr:unnamed protein product [Timema monikensis]